MTIRSQTTIIVLLFFITGKVTSFPQELNDVGNSIHSRCEITNKAYWKIIDWFFRDTSFILVTILNADKKFGFFESLFVKHLTASKLRHTFSFFNYNFSIFF